MKRLNTLLLLVLLLAGVNTCFAAQTIKAKPVVSILGDSYSTFKGYVPEGNRTWYDTKVNKDRTDVNDVRQTWWWQFIDEGGFILGRNESYSGSTVCNSGYHFDDYSDRSFITRLPRLGTPDLILIFGATNDSWAKAPLGEFVYDDFKRGHLYEFRPAFAYMLNEAQKLYPGATIYVLVNDVLDKAVESSIVEVCKHYGVEAVMLHDIDKRQGHPTVLGMKQIKEQLLKVVSAR